MGVYLSRKDPRFPIQHHSLECAARFSRYRFPKNNLSLPSSTWHFPLPFIISMACTIRCPRCAVFTLSRVRFICVFVTTMSSSSTRFPGSFFGWRYYRHRHRHYARRMRNGVPCSGGEPFLFLPILISSLAFVAMQSFHRFAVYLFGPAVQDPAHAAFFCSSGLMSFISYLCRVRRFSVCVDAMI